MPSKSHWRLGATARVAFEVDNRQQKDIPAGHLKCSKRKIACRSIEQNHGSQFIRFDGSVRRPGRICKINANGGSVTAYWWRLWNHLKKPDGFHGRINVCAASYIYQIINEEEIKGSWRDSLHSEIVGSRKYTKFYKIVQLTPKKAQFRLLRFCGAGDSDAGLIFQADFPDKSGWFEAFDFG